MEKVFSCLEKIFSIGGKIKDKHSRFKLRHKQSRSSVELGDLLHIIMKKSVFVVHVAHNAVLGFLDEVKDVVNFVAHRYLFRNFDDGVFKTEVGRVDDAVSVGDMTQDALGNTFVLQHNGVDAVITGGIATENNVRRHVFLHTAAALHERVAANVDALLDNYATALDGTVFDFALTGNAHADTYNAVVVYLHVVADVDSFHQEIAIADTRGVVGSRTTGYDYVLTEAVVIAYDHVGLVAFHVMEILRRCADDSVLVNNVTASHRRTFEDAGVRHDDTIIANGYTFFDVGERFHFNVLTEFGLGVNVC